MKPLEENTKDLLREEYEYLYFEAYGGLPRDEEIAQEIEDAFVEPKWEEEYVHIEGDEGISIDHVDWVHLMQNKFVRKNHWKKNE